MYHRRLLNPLWVVVLALVPAVPTETVAAPRFPWSSSSPHERYAESLKAARLDATALGRAWATASAQALKAPAAVNAPFRETGYCAPDQATAFGYRFPLQQGQRIRAVIAPESDAPVQMFVDLFKAAGRAGAEPERVTQADSGALELTAEARESGDYLLRIQPELLRGVRFTVTVEVLPSLTFPLPGKDTRAVWSRFGVDRDGGARRHEGLDIFAPKGTPVVAAAAGRVMAVTWNALGGNVVWVVDAERRIFHYYAHLDRFSVTWGQRLEAGDQVGTVGNSGNARLTPPHLHYGIYTADRGAVDPYPFLQRSPDPAAVTASTEALGTWVRSGRSGARLRASPSAVGRRLRDLGRHTLLEIRAASGNWYRARLPDGAEGYVSARAVESADEPLRQAQVGEETPVRVHPRPEAPTVINLPPGEGYAVHGSFKGYVYAKDPEGRSGWIAPSTPVRTSARRSPKAERPAG
ncbi:MAG TPA: M23 family metallopeptidase [Myxococcaceae bacterium]|nr:M23 family metallopeptidase [Myxococcaceae bacterium]